MGFFDWLQDKPKVVIDPIEFDFKSKYDNKELWSHNDMHTCVFDISKIISLDIVSYKPEKFKNKHALVQEKHMHRNERAICAVFNSYEDAVSALEKIKVDMKIYDVEVDQKQKLLQAESERLEAEQAAIDLANKKPDWVLFPNEIIVLNKGDSKKISSKIFNCDIIRYAEVDITLNRTTYAIVHRETGDYDSDYEDWAMVFTTKYANNVLGENIFTHDYITMDSDTSELFFRALDEWKKIYGYPLQNGQNGVSCNSDKPSADPELKQLTLIKG